MKNKIIIGISGASGAVYAKVLLNKLVELSSQFEQAAVLMTNNAKQIWMHELGDRSYENYPFTFYEMDNYNAPFASGSSQYNILIICPCSMGTLARVASGTSDTLLLRAADVILKERRKLILVLRETPYSLIHINNMKKVTLSGGIICPATPSFYTNPKDISEVAATVVERVLDIAGIKSNGKRWQETL